MNAKEGNVVFVIVHSSLEPVEIMLFSTLDNLRCHALLVRESVHCTVTSEVIGLRTTWASAERSHVVALLSGRYSYRGSD